MAIDINTPSQYVCYRCGKKYSSSKGYFQACYSPIYKGVGKLPYCRDCVDSIFNGYYAACGDTKQAMRQVCRKLDLYWSEDIYNAIIGKNPDRTIPYAYITKVNQNTYLGKCYDDTLTSENTLWTFKLSDSELSQKDSGEPIHISQDVIDYWGEGHDPEMYLALEKRREDWVKNYPDANENGADVDALIKQICFMEVDINNARADGKSVDKLVPILNSLLGSLSTKSKKKKSEDSDLESTPLGVWLWRYENERPLPEVSEDLKDVNGLKKYIFTWLGHICKMVGLKNGYTRMYEEEIERLRVQHPEYDDEDDESMLIDVFGDD